MKPEPAKPLKTPRDYPHLTLRLSEPSQVTKLDAAAKRRGVSRNALVKQFIEEGLRRVA